MIFIEYTYLIIMIITQELKDLFEDIRTYFGAPMMIQCVGF